MQDVGRGIATGAANACCTPTTGAGTPGTDSPENETTAAISTSMYRYGFSSFTSIPPFIGTALMRPRRPKQYCLQLYIYIYIITKIVRAL